MAETNGNGNGMERVIDRIRKLLALSESPNEHEAAVAAGKAQAMLAEYNISLSDVADKDATEVDESIVVDAAGRTSSLPWRRPLALSVAEMYFCKYFYTTVRIKKTAHDIHHFVGAKHNIAVAKIMFAYLHETIDRLAKEGALKVPPKERSPYRTSFRGTCSNRVRQRIAERIAAGKRGQIVTEGGKNLPALLDLYKSWDQRNQAFLDKEFSGMRVTRSKQALPHAQGALEGRIAGDGIGLDMQVDKSKQHAQIERSKVRNGTVRFSDSIDFNSDTFKRSHDTHPGYYVWFGMWKGPFETADYAKDAYREWSCEARYS